MSEDGNATRSGTDAETATDGGSNVTAGDAVTGSDAPGDDAGPAGTEAGTAGDGVPDEPIDDVARAVKRPAVVSGAVAVVLSVLVVSQLVDAGGATTAVALEAVGAGALAAGLLLGKRERWIVGGALGVVGIGAALAALAQAVALPRNAATVTLLPGLVGVTVLALAVTPARDGGSRGLVKVGCGLVLLAALLGGALNETGDETLLYAAVGTVVAWDAADNAISVGKQLGRTARTIEAELAHLVGSVAVGGVAVFLAQAVHGIGPSGLSLAQVTIVLLATVLLAAAMYD